MSNPRQRFGAAQQQFFVVAYVGDYITANNPNFDNRKFFMWNAVVVSIITSVGFGIGPSFPAIYKSYRVQSTVPTFFMVDWSRDVIGDLSTLECTFCIICKNIGMSNAPLLSWFYRRSHNIHGSLFNKSTLRIF